MRNTLAAAASLLGLALAAPCALAKVSAEEAARLGQNLTPVGAERAGNAAGTIPEWTPTSQRGSPAGEFPVNPDIDGDKPLFTITAANMAQYADKLAEGHKELLRRFPDSYRMNVYPSHRLLALPEPIYAATIANATTCELATVDLVDNCTLGYPFPIPQSGAEVIWNHKLKFRGNRVTRYNNQMIVQTDGRFQLTRILEDAEFLYASPLNPGTLKVGGNAEMFRYLSQTLSPPRLAGTYILVHERMGAGAEGRAAWLYSPGLRRIRRAPTVCCDNPYEGTDGHQYYDQVDMFNGTLEMYNWKLIGKREMYLPYNANRIAGPTVKYEDIAAPRHVNQDLPRYELHRMWVVEAENLPGRRHTFKRRVFYVDEDSWNIVAVDLYDQRDGLMQFQEGHFIVGYDILSMATTPEVIYHFNSGRYFVTAMANEERPNNHGVTFDGNYFSAATVQRRTAR